jgi:hypothetical protein
VKLTKKTRRKDGLLFGHIKETRKCKNNDMSPELYEAERLMNEEIEEAVDDLINNFKRADVDEDD